MSSKPWSDEDLMAYADGESSAEAHAQLTAALAADAALRGRVDALAAQRRRVAAAFEDVLDEPVPDRLAALLQAPAAAPPVVDLGAERARRGAPAVRPARELSWVHWGGMAASLALGVALGLNMGSRVTDRDALVTEVGGQVVAGARLERVLSRQGGAEGTVAGLAVPLSFQARDGRYCRVFRTDRVAGLACRAGDHWTLQTTVAAEAGSADGGMRQAASALPRALLEAVDGQIAGVAMTPEQENAARDRGWR